MDWLKYSFRPSLLVLLASLAGWLAGHTLLFATISLAAMIIVFARRGLQVRDWLRDPEQSPPDLGGFWGECSRQVEEQQRRARKREDDLGAPSR